jgi:glycosyltransferase involved in cell wall biosynthesis
MRTFRYKNILLFSSPQFSGNISEYFIEHTEKLIIYVTMPRFNNKFNLVRHYNNGKLVSEKKVISSGNVFLYYFYWYCTYLNCLLICFSRQEKFFVITWQPYFFFGGTIQKLIRKISFVYWVGDYFPPVTPTLRLYEKIKKYYATQIPYVCYLSDRINMKMNGRVVDTKFKKTIAWGVKPNTEERKIGKKFILCFIGVIKPSQGLEVLLKAVQQIKTVELKILGSGNDTYVQKYKKLIDEYDIKNRVFFPNKMYYDKQIAAEVKDCSIGVALYDVNKNSATYYADPGKIKTYAQYGLPILMTPIADVEKYINKFFAGEIVSQDIKDVERAIQLMKKKYKKYTKGIADFNSFFDYEKYYKEKFAFLEK